MKNVTESKSRTIVFDSSCWIEIFTQGPLSRLCDKEFKNASQILVPTVVIYEVYRKISLTVSEDQALSAVALMSQYKIVDLNRDISLTAADLSIGQKLPMADSFVLAHARYEDAILVTLDNDFRGMSNTKVLR